MPEARGRLRGFERPFSPNQLFSWVGNAIITGSFYALCLLVLLRPALGCGKTVVGIMLLAHAALVLGGFACWLFLEMHPPTRESVFSRMLPDSQRWTKVRYCREHKDVVPGLDHFCTWLNTSIGRSNYIPFYLIALFGTLQYALHVAILVFLLAACGRSDLGVAMQTLIGICVVLGTLVWCAYVALFVFHTHLSVHGIGTYDWILKQQQRPAIELAPRGHDRVPPSDGRTGP